MTGKKVVKRLATELVSNWPVLSWVAIMNRRTDRVKVLHGRFVETGPSWCVEGVWDGDFAEGDFDKTDLVFGTGVRVRNDEVVFVSSGDTLNRLHYHQSGDTLHVSNSFAALLALADLELVDGFDYADAMSSITKGLNSCEKSVACSRGRIELVYCHNLRLRNNRLYQVEKPVLAPSFSSYSVYRDYLFDTARRLVENAETPSREHRVRTLATISSGYDSCAAALLARQAGVEEAATLEQGRRYADNIFDVLDSGEPVAQKLGMRCRTYSRFRQNYPFEDSAWASMGNVGDINLALFDYPEPPYLLFTGFMGDILWAKDTTQPEPLHRKDSSGARFNELRLELGVFNCSPVFWGWRNESDILRLSGLPEMRPWTLENHYDRPIPRRLLEEAGVDRHLFGMKKRVSGFNRRYGRPLSQNLQHDFASFLAKRGLRPSSRFAELMALGLDGFDWKFLRKLPQPFRFSCRDRIRLPSPTMFFIWANERRKKRFLEDLPSTLQDQQEASNATRRASRR